MKKSIALIAGSFPAPGRPELVFVQQLVWALVDMDVKVTVIAPQSLTHLLIRRQKLLPKHSVEFTKNANSFDLYRPYTFSFGNKFAFLTKFTDFILNWQLNTILDRINPNVLYGHFWHMANCFTPYALKHKLPLFVACGEGDNALEDLATTLSVEKKKNLVHAVRGVISVSSDNKRKCIDFGLVKGEDVIVLPNCVDTELIHPSDNRYMREKLGVKDDDFLIAFVGGFIKRKGADRLAAAIEKLKDDKIKVFFIGKPLGGDVALPKCNGIVYQGTLNHDEIPPFLQAADVFVLPTLKEGCSNAIVEALATGLPVISADRPFNDDILNSNNSITVNPESIDAIADAIYRLKSDHELYCAMRSYALAHSNDYSIVERAKMIYNFIEKQICEDKK